MSTQNKAVIFNKVPDSFPVPGEHLVVKDIGFDPSSCPPNSINVETLYLSLDPYMRGRMRDPSVKSYSPGFQLDKPLANSGIGRVIKSTSDKYAEGDLVVSFLSFQEYQTIDLEKAQPEKVNLENGPKDVRSWLGVLGMPGLTAYSSLMEIGKPKKGETIFISSAAGAVGQLVGQLAKHHGLTVIGSVGSDDKLKYLTEELKFDSGFNYKTENAGDALKRLAPNGIHIYYDNVGGEQLDAAFDSLNDYGRIVACGMISQYNKPQSEKYGVKNLMNVVAKRITMRGFIVSDKDMGPVYHKEHRENLVKWLNDGSFTSKVSEWSGIDNGAQALVGMLKGENFGKAVLKVKA